MAIQLTLDDFSVFRSIESAEFVDKVFGLISANQETAEIGNGNGAGATTATNSNGDGNATEPPSEGSRKGFPTGCVNLDAFADLVNKEAYWVPSEICAETNLQKRVDMLKRFIKVRAWYIKYGFQFWFSKSRLFIKYFLRSFATK